MDSALNCSLAPHSLARSLARSLPYLRKSAFDLAFLVAFDEEVELALPGLRGRDGEHGGRRGEREGGGEGERDKFR